MRYRTFTFMTITAILYLATFCASAPAKPADDPDAPFETATGDGLALSVPRGWKNMDKFSPQVLIFRQSNGTGGVPETDENGAPMQTQIIVEKIQMEPGLEDSATVVARRITSEPQTDVVVRPAGEVTKLSDDTKAYFLSAEVIKQGNRRVLMMKLLAKSDDKNGFIVTGTIAAGKDSTIPTADSATAKWLKAMISSFVLDVNKLDVDKVKKAYQERDKKR